MVLPTSNGLASTEVGIPAGTVASDAPARDGPAIFDPIRVGGMRMAAVTEQSWTRDPRDRPPDETASRSLPSFATRHRPQGRPLPLCPHGYVNQHGDLCAICDGDADMTGLR